MSSPSIQVLTSTTEKPRQNPPSTQLVKNDPCYAHIPCTSIIYVHIHEMKFLFGNKANLKPETLNPGLLYKVSEVFLGKCSHLTLISSIFSSVTR
jgi:hypothetical protein